MGENRPVARRQYAHTNWVRYYGKLFRADAGDSHVVSTPDAQIVGEETGAIDFGAFDPGRGLHRFFGNRCGRFVAPPGRLRLRNDAIVEDSGLPDATDANAVQHSLSELPTDTLTFLLPSRYCEVEKLSTSRGIFSATRRWAGRGCRRFVIGRINGLNSITRTRAATARHSKLTRTTRRVPGLHAPGDYALPLHGYSGALCDGLFGRHLCSAGSRPDGFQRVVRSLRRRTMVHA